jgi:hypothetical protein
MEKWKIVKAVLTDELSMTEGNHSSPFVSANLEFV